MNQLACRPIRPTVVIMDVAFGAEVYFTLNRLGREIVSIDSSCIFFGFKFDLGESSMLSHGSISDNQRQ